MNPKWPVYVVSKGRWDSRLTVKTLEEMRVPYFIIIEQSEFENYAKVISKENILILPQRYLDNYDTCDGLGDSKGKGPGAARNFAWEHSIKYQYADWHWVLDDNIRGFFVLSNNTKIRASVGTIFRAAEEFVERYENVAIAGFNYHFFAKRKQKIPPFIINTRIYSCLLIRNDIGFYWRGRYNEDTDLCLRALKAGWCTVQFNAFLQGKMKTQALKGGNTDMFYAQEGTLNKSRMLCDLHPDVSRLVYKFKRWHHHVDYSYFMRANKLKKRDDCRDFKDCSNNYGMYISEVNKNEN